MIIRPIISEKSFDLASAKNQYCFKVEKASNKMQIKEAVEKTFGVNVTNVRTLTLRPKKVRFGKYRTEGRRGAWKKALVTLKGGDKIELFESK